MRLTVTEHPVNDGVVRLAVDGELERSTVEVLVAAVERAITVDHVAELILDLDGVTLLDDAGADAVVTVTDRAGDDGVAVVVIGPAERVRRTLRLGDVLDSLTEPEPWAGRSS
ncbi:RNA polymerase sigma-B factor [Micromonospora pattaloongensis]|uniref:RNA polymerase sigma-B factor n=1 Tax=Micromonospora pattaloongensis TaxID=405436 RepID=A0A1H3NNN2_9ACTN|nr:STAS domain-containing protein [Micromonospora pattaloongensis]SDY90025.1 RNA polymerase sigma-B factor [Micromonospora pattaloongensis]